MITNENLISENAALRSALELNSPGCTAKIATPKKGATMDEFFSEGDALAKVQAAFASKTGVQSRGAAVLARYKPTPANDRALLAAFQDGSQSPAVFTATQEVIKFEHLLKSAVGMDKEILKQKLSIARDQLANAEKAHAAYSVPE